MSSSRPNTLAAASGIALLLILITIELVGNFVEGVSLGERDMLFYPMYRTRQSMAVAISMMRSPPASGYLAYGSVSESLKSSGLEILDPDDDWIRRERLFHNTPALNKAITDSLNVPLDASLPLETIKGNDLGYSDFIHLSFILFGPKVSSLYDFYFLLLLTSTLAFIAQFYRSRFLLLVLSAYMAVHLFLLVYCSSFGPPIGSIANDRTFTALGILPTLHLIAQLFDRGRVRPIVLATGLLQALLLAFVISCRFEAMWEVAAILAVAGLVGVSLVLQARTEPILRRARRLRSLWPAAFLVVILAGFHARVELVTDSIYQNEAKTHIVWDSVLIGFLSNDSSLFQEYTGRDRSLWDKYVLSDELGCEAVKHYLRSKNDPRGSLIGGYDCDKGTFFYGGETGTYDRFARAVVFQMTWDHPLIVLKGLSWKYRQQMDMYYLHHTFTLANFQLPLACLLASVFVFWLAGGPPPITPPGAARAVVAGSVLLCAALISPFISPSPFSIGSLATYLIFAAIGLAMTLIGCLGAATWLHHSLHARAPAAE